MSLRTAKIRCLCGNVVNVIQTYPRQCQCGFTLSFDVLTNGDLEPWAFMSGGERIDLSRFPYQEPEIISFGSWREQGLKQ